MWNLTDQIAAQEQIIENCTSTHLVNSPGGVPLYGPREGKDRQGEPANERMCQSRGNMQVASTGMLHPHLNTLWTLTDSMQTMSHLEYSLVFV